MKKLQIFKDTEIDQSNLSLDIINPCELTFTWGYGPNVEINNISDGDVTIINDGRYGEDILPYTLQKGSSITFYFNNGYHILGMREDVKTQMDIVTSPIGASVGQVLTWTGAEAEYQDSEGGITVDANHFFSDNIERDAYFVSNPGELSTTVVISVGAEYQQYNGSDWIDVTALVDSSIASQKGDTIWRIPDGNYFAMVFDDGRSDLYDAWTNHLQPDNIPMNVAMPYKLYGNSLSPAQLREIVANGGEVINHGYTSAPLVGATDAVINQEVVIAKQLLENYKIPVYGYLPAGNAFNVDKIDTWLKPNYSYAMANPTGDVIDFDDGLYQVNRIDMADNLTNVKLNIDQAIVDKRPLIMYAHGIGTGELYVSVADYDEIVAYVITQTGGDYEFLSVYELLLKVSNVARLENSNLGLKNKNPRIKSPNRVANPAFETYKRSGGDPVGWVFDDTNLSGTYTKSIERGPGKPSLNLNFNSDNVDGDFLLVIQDVWVGDVTDLITGLFSLGYITTRNNIEVIVDLYSGDVLLENLVSVVGTDINHQNGFDEDFTFYNANTATYLRITIKIYADAANWYTRLWEPSINTHCTPMSDGPNQRQMAQVYSTIDNTLIGVAGAEEIINIGDSSSVARLNAIMDVTGEKVAPYRGGMYKMDVEVILTPSNEATYSGDVTIYLRTDEGQEKAKSYYVYITGAVGTQFSERVIKFTDYLDLKPREYVGVYVKKLASSNLVVRSDSGFIMEEER